MITQHVISWAAIPEDATQPSFDFLDLTNLQLQIKAPRKHAKAVITIEKKGET